VNSDLKESIGYYGVNGMDAEENSRMLEYVNLKLAARGFEIVGSEEDFPFLQMGRLMISNFQERLRVLADFLCPADRAIDGYLRSVLAEFLPEISPNGEPLIPADALYLERHGIARILSLPAQSDKFESSILTSFRVAQGVCHNPAKDRRTTKGVFHVAEGGLPVPGDKKEVPLVAFARLLHAALHPPDELHVLPFTVGQKEPAHIFASLLLRPVVSPGVQDVRDEKRMEVRFFAPGSLVANLDFVESIFGNAGDPSLPDNDSRLDPLHWSGHTGCVILAPHLITLRKKDMGLPHRSAATPRQIQDGMCWDSEHELYNDGGAFKITCRDTRGIVVTLIADNYFGYCKKEVKTQISFAANLLGNCEEEHAGGAIALPSFDLGEYFSPIEHNREFSNRWADVLRVVGDRMQIQPEGYGVDIHFPDVCYMPEDASFNLHAQEIRWHNTDGPQKIDLQPKISYVLPSGYQITMVQPSRGQRWRLIGTQAEGTFCHKPCTVSGGGKSEISKSLADAMISGSVIVPEFRSDIEKAVEILGRDFGDRYTSPREPGKPSRPLLSPERSLGSVVRLLSPRPEYTDAYNAWVASIPRSAKELVFIIKRFYKPDWEEDWVKRFSVDKINGQPGQELKYRRQKLVTNYLRIGFTLDGRWRTFGLRKDFSPANKVQTEDDISASIVIPTTHLEYLHPEISTPAVKFVKNCEFRLFQRPDEAIHRGYDHTAELDFSRPGVFFSNYEPLTRDQVRDQIRDAIRFGQFTPPMQQTLTSFEADTVPDYAISTAHPRIVDGKPSENPRYLQNRDDLENPRKTYLMDVGIRLARRIPPNRAVHLPVSSVISGRRNNPPDAEAGIRSLAVYNPIHFQELPELFMDYVASLTGKSPSTTGAGSEGALTKGPFNALLPIHDLNNALISFIVTGQHGFSTAAGYIGHKYRVDHDISLLVPEIWSRMFVHERNPAYLIANGLLEKIDDFEFEGRTIPASRLGYRITAAFSSTFLSRVFSEPAPVFSAEMLRPELQSLPDFVDGIENIVSTQEKVALRYFEDGSAGRAIPPLRALLEIMAYGQSQGRTIGDPDFRALFTYESLVASDWYQARIDRFVAREKEHLSTLIPYLEDFLQRPHYDKEASRLGVADRLSQVRARLAAIETPHWRDSLTGSIGLDLIG
jgi:hypothetical protein